MAGGWIDVLVEQIRPQQPLVIFGDGPDVAPLVQAAHALGWHVTVVGMRSEDGLRQRFRRAATVVSCDPKNPAAAVVIPTQAAVVLMMHDIHRDAMVLRSIATAPPSYVGILGPLQRTVRLLAFAHLPADPPPNWLYAPVGLDIGSDSPETIALSIVAEINAVLAGRTGGLLRDRAAAVCETPAPVMR